MSFEKIIENCKGPAPKAHTPAFRIEPTEPGWTIFDGQKALAHAMPTAMDIWSFSPFEPDEMANKTRKSRVLDVHTVHNTWIGLALHGWPRAWAALGAGGLKWDWRKSSGPELEAMVTLEAPNGEWGHWLFKLRYDQAWGRYRYTWDIEARTVGRDGMELFNMMITHALADRPETRRWTHTVSPNSDGRIMKMPNSNALFLTHGFDAMRHTSYPRSWVAYLAHPSFNPTTIVHSTTVPLFYATCDQLFDQHLIWTNAAMDNVEADGYYHFKMSVEFANLRPAAAKEILEKAHEPVRVHRAASGNGRAAVPFRMDVVNSFEEELDPWKPVECPMLVIDKKQAGSIDWDPTSAHTGKKSIRLTAHHQADRREFFPIGAVCLVKPQTRYKLTGWVRTKNVQRFARLELTSCEYTYANTIEQAHSASVSGDKDWTQVEAVLNTGDQAYVLPKMVLYGEGEAWFDDLCLTEAK